jgi:hypothetical protein
MRNSIYNKRHSVRVIEAKKALCEAGFWPIPFGETPLKAAKNAGLFIPKAPPDETLIVEVLPREIPACKAARTTEQFAALPADFGKAVLGGSISHPIVDVVLF